MNRCFVVLALLLAACGPRRTGSMDSNAAELCVQNETVGYGNVVARAGPIRFDVQPGQEVCKRLAGVGSGFTLTARTTGGGAAGPLAFRRELPSPFGCWLWRLDNSRISTLEPCD